MASPLFLEVVTPQRTFFSGEIEMVVVKTPDGEMGVMKGHIPMVVAVSVGRIKILKDGEWLTAFVSEGFIEIQRSRTILLVDTAEWPHEIDINRAKAARERALERLHRQMSHVEYTRTQAAISRALARLKVSREIKE